MSDRRCLHPCAVTIHNTAGRQYAEKPCPYRDCFEVDRGRIIQSPSFRRLEGKTQVFTTGLNDQYRTRMTHSIEVAQIGRLIARALELNETLTETICLGHDIGHSPFGHVGEQTLAAIMKDHGGFEHNRQALRIVDFIETPFPGRRGLNLMKETRLGFAGHCSPYDNPERQADGPRQPSLEGQIANVADRIAYNCHDLEDGLRSRWIHEQQLDGIELYRLATESLKPLAISDPVIRRVQISMAIMDVLTADVIETSRDNLVRSGFTTVGQVYNSPVPLIALSAHAVTQLQSLEAFLLEKLYHYPDIIEVNSRTESSIKTLFVKVKNDPSVMPTYYRKMIETEGIDRVVCDFIAGMTDRYCRVMLEKLA